MNHNQGLMVVVISVEPIMEDVDVTIVTRGVATTREDGPLPQVWLAGKNKASFDITTERDILFEVQDAIERNPSKSPVYEIPSTFDSSLDAWPSRQHVTLQNFFESFLSLARYSDALAEIDNLLHRPWNERKDSSLDSLHKKKMGKEMCMNIQIGDYEVD